MREIKFRTWTGQQMDYNIMAGFLGAFYVQGINEYDRASMSQFNTKYPENCHVMQFTGLLDKNGKEVYEGDILKLQYPLNYGFAGIHNKEIIVTISFESGCFWFSGEGYTDCNWHFYNEYEVIGNIYENPELL